MKAFCGFKSRNSLHKIVANSLSEIGIKVDCYTFSSTISSQSQIGSHDVLLKKDVNERTLFLNDKNKIKMVLKNIFFPIFILRLIKVFFRYDYYFFFAGYSILSFPLKWSQFNSLRYLDIFFLKLFNKKIIYTFQGSDLRYDGTLPIDKKRVFKYADVILVTTPDLISFIPEAYKKKAHIINRPIEFANHTTTKTPKRRSIKVLHAPTNFSIKGTEYIISAFSEIKKQFDIELVILNNTTNEHVISTAKQCDFAIDQLILGWYGVFTLEMLSIGLPVMCYMSDLALDNSQMMRDTIPITNIKKETIIEDVLKMIDNVKKESWLQSFEMNRQNFLDNYYSQHSLNSKLQSIIEEISI